MAATLAQSMLCDWYKWTGCRQPTDTDALAYLDYQHERGVITTEQYETALDWMRFTGIGWYARWLTEELIGCARVDADKIRRQKRRPVHRRSDRR